MTVAAPVAREDRGSLAPPINVTTRLAGWRPRRMVRPRVKGYKTPAGVIYAGQPSLLCNHFEHRRDGEGRRRFRHAAATKLFRRWLPGNLGALSLERLGYSAAEIATLDRRRVAILNVLPHLFGHDFQCWCPLTSRWCHVDTIIALIVEPLA